jgi:hypothetical protein
MIGSGDSIRIERNGIPYNSNLAEDVVVIDEVEIEEVGSIPACL